MAFRLLVLAVVELAEPSDFFRCTPYGAVMTASACLQRQLRAAEAAAIGSSERFDKRPLGDYRLCNACSTGEDIAEKIALVDAPVKLNGRPTRGRRRHT